MPKQSYSLEFQPKERRHRDQVMRFLGGFFAIVLLLGIVSAVALFREDLWAQFQGALNPTETATEPPEDFWTHTGSAALLLCETDDEQQSLRFCILVRADISNRKIHIFPLSPKALTPHETGERTLEQALREGGPKELKAAAEALTEGTIDRFICSGDSAFVSAVNRLTGLTGSVTVHVEERIDYHSADLDFLITKGENVPLSGDSLLRYFRYLGTLGENGTPAQGGLMQRVLEACLSSKPDAQALESLFNTLMNMLQTDVTVNDFYTRRAMLLDILASGDKFTVDVKE